VLDIKGRCATTVSAPLVNEAPLEPWPERPRTRVFPGQKWYYRPAKKLAALIPGPLVDFLRRCLDIPSGRIKK
jgi:hypothetical protein